MISPSDDLFSELIEKMKYAEASLKMLKNNGIEKAKTEKEYQTIKRQEFLKHKESGEPVTMIGETIKGVPSVAEERCKRDVAVVIYNTNIQALNLYKMEMRLISEQIGREWNE